VAIVDDLVRRDTNAARVQNDELFALPLLRRVEVDFDAEPDRLPGILLAKQSRCRRPLQTIDDEHRILQIEDIVAHNIAMSAHSQLDVRQIVGIHVCLEDRLERRERHRFALVVSDLQSRDPIPFDDATQDLPLAVGLKSRTGDPDR